MSVTQIKQEETVKLKTEDLALSKAESMANFARYIPGQTKGHYESFFQRANHPEKPQGFWIRYTIFSPAGKPEDAIGELWAIYFDGEKNEHVAVKAEIPFNQCSFENKTFSARVGAAVLNGYSLKGEIEQHHQSIEWQLEYKSEEDPLFLLPLSLYDGGFPKAKALVGGPMSLYNGTLKVNGKKIKIDNWMGSQNHNWGSRHTDRYAWGQVARFDNAPNSFLEVGTAQIKLGPIYTPKLTIFVLRHKGKEYQFNQFSNFLSNKAHYDYFEWRFSGDNGEVKLDGIISGRAKDFVGLNYYNPPGSSKTCLNSKIASCHLTLSYKDGKAETLTTENRAAFEILTTDDSHGIKVRC